MNIIVDMLLILDGLTDWIDPLIGSYAEIRSIIMTLKRAIIQIFCLAKKGLSKRVGGYGTLSVLIF